VQKRGQKYFLGLTMKKNLTHYQIIIGAVLVLGFIRTSHASEEKLNFTFKDYYQTILMITRDMNIKIDEPICLNRTSDRGVDCFIKSPLIHFNAHSNFDNNDITELEILCMWFSKRRIQECNQVARRLFEIDGPNKTQHYLDQILLVLNMGSFIGTKTTLSTKDRVYSLSTDELMLISVKTLKSAFIKPK
jgi:hypothetical protein